jgi:hypothetical protein
VYQVQSISGGYVLGIIKWHSPWRQYWFEPADGTGWSSGCLDEVRDFIKSLMDERKDLKRKRVGKRLND